MGVARLGGEGAEAGLGVVEVDAVGGKGGDEEGKELMDSVEEEVLVGLRMGVGCWEEVMEAEETRDGTRYSRAPSGEDWRRMGVSISVKSGWISKTQ